MSFFVVVVVVVVNRKSAYNPDISTMVYRITVILAGMKALVVTELQCTNCIGSPKETDATLRYS